MIDDQYQIVDIGRFDMPEERHPAQLAEDVARPVLYHNRSGTCWHPYVKGYVPMINSIYNGNRMEEVWLDK